MNTPSSQPTTNPSAEIQSGDIESEINLLDVLIALGQEKFTVIVLTLLAAFAGVVISLTTPPTYVARTSLMPAQQGSASALASLSGLAGLAGLSGMSGAVKSSDQMYIALMRSQSVQIALIDQLKLKERYGSKNLEEARMSLTNSVSIAADKSSGLLVIEAQDGDPEFAAQLANQQVNELNVILSRLAITEAQQRRLYYEQQIAKTQQNLPVLETRFKEAQKKSGVEVASLLSESGSLPGQIAAKELQLQILSRFATAQNPEMKRLSTEISALRSQLSRYELAHAQGKGSDKANTTGNVKATSPFQQEAAQAYTTLKIQETLLDGFVRQLEVAKIDEAKEGPTLQVLDVARAPEIRAKPERRKLVIAYTVTGLVIGLVLALLKALLRHAQSTPEGIQRLRDLQRAWGIRGIKA
jgi:capsule polysaccharide export protein KpsE/RkpR